MNYVIGLLWLILARMYEGEGSIAVFFSVLGVANLGIHFIELITGKEKAK